MAPLPKNRYLIFVALTAFTLTLDLWSKSIVFERLGLFGRTEWLIDSSWVRFELHTSLNEGALWGMGQGFAPVFAGLSVLAFGAILYVLFVRKAAASLWLTCALGLVSGGTLGNFYDRMGWHGVRLPGSDTPARAVRDFLHFQFGSFHWPIFNVADICLVTGAVMLMIQSMAQDQESAPATSSGTSEVVEP